MDEAFNRDLILILNGIIVELKKLNENVGMNANATEKLADQVDELGIEIYKYRKYVCE